MKEIRTPLFTVIFIFLALLIYTKVFGPIPFYVNNVTTTKNTLFTVNGTGEVTAVPDTALVTLGVEKTAPQVESAKDQVNKIINQITDDVKKLGVDSKNIQTTNFSVNPQYDYTNGNNKVTGYSVNATIEVRIQPIDKANNAVDAATKDGATQVGNVQFVVNDTQKKSLESEARKKAIQDAKDKADSISKDAGIHLGNIVDVQENADNNPGVRPVLMDAKASNAAGEAVPPTQLNPGENKITSNVSISYETF